MRKKTLVWLLLLVIVIVGFWAFLRPTATVPARTPVAAAIPVTSAVSSRQDVPVYLEGLGNVQAFNAVTIRSQVDGQLLQVAFKEGQEVHAGELLAQIDPRTYQAALDQSLAKKAQDEAQLANARADLARYTSLVEKNYVARQQLDTTSALVKQLVATVQGDNAAIENARVLLGYTSIKSPIDGRAGIRLVDAGNIVKSADTTGLVMITQVHPISVLFTLPESTVVKIVPAMTEGPLKVVVLNRDGKQELDTGVLQLIDNQIDTTTATVRLKATMPNKKNLLWPGQFVNVRIKVATLPKVITVPANAVQRGPQGAYAFVVKSDATVEMRALQVGEVSEGMAVIEDGIKEGETVVVEGQYRLQQGSRVEARTASLDGSASPVRAE